MDDEKEIQIGSWSFQENEKGDLVIINTETNQEVTLVVKQRMGGNHGKV